MWIQTTNLARVCTAKWQPLWIKKGTHKYCQVFVSPYNWDQFYFYDGEWVAVDDETFLVYEWANWREYNSETDGLAVQYSNKVVKSEPGPEPGPTDDATIDIISANSDMWTIRKSDDGERSAYWSFTLPSWTRIEYSTMDYSNDSLRFGYDDFYYTATPNEGYRFIWWNIYDETPAPSEVALTTTLIAYFEQETPPAEDAPNRWPAPEWYHVPTTDEQNNMVMMMWNIWIDTSNGDCMKTYLKIPFAGYRSRSSSSVGSQGAVARYWSSTAYSAGYAYYLLFYSSSLDPQNGDYRAYGFSLRCFKNSPTVPDASWTTLWDGSQIIQWAGIFRNETEWLISISDDWENWITIMDKNLGATVVYNDGDELSESNCGKYYQRWNNYWFGRSWEVTTSSTQVDASWYWPWNYYNDSTFIIENYDWSSVQNDNLWWWEQV